MAQRAKPAFNTEDNEASNSHARFLELSKNLDDIQLAAHFGVTIPTVRKWKSLPLGYQPKKPGRNKTAPVATTAPGP